MVSKSVIRSALTLRISVTDRCNLRCQYCMPKEGIEIGQHNEFLSFEEIMQVVRAIHDAEGEIAVRLTGGEPLLRRNITDLVAMLNAEGVDDIALTTNGQHLARMAESLKQAGLKRVNVSLDSLQAERFSHLTRGGRVNKTLEGISAAIDSGLAPVKLNAVVLRGVNDDEVCDLVHFAIVRGCVIRFIEVMPIGEAITRHQQWYVPTGEIKKRLEQEFVFEAKHAQNGAPARSFSIRSLKTGACGTLGFISSVSHPFCNGCRRLRLTSRGQLLGCLLKNTGVDLRCMIRSGASQWELLQTIQQVLALKAVGRDPYNSNVMATIGG